MAEGIEVTGIKELTKSFKQLGGEAPKRLRKTKQEIAKRLVPPVQAGARRRGGSAEGLARSVRTSATSKAVLIRLGVGNNRRGVPFGEYVRGSVFGSNRFEQFNEPNPDGWWGYPEIRAQEDETREFAFRQFEELIDEAFS